MSLNSTTVLQTPFLHSGLAYGIAGFFTWAAFFTSLHQVLYFLIKF